jgi:SAM-dependent methyltransferase
MTQPPEGNSPPALSASIDELAGEVRLMVEGSVQSVQVAPGVTPAGYWRALVPETPPNNALFLGLGGATGVQLLWQRYGPVPVVGVDNNPRVLQLGMSRFGLDDPALHVIQANALDYVRSCNQQFGLVVVDIYDGEAAPAFVANRRFIRAVRQLVRPGGTLVWNLQRDRRGALIRRRSRAGLLLERRIFAGLNLVLHYRRRAHPRRLAQQ